MLRFAAASWLILLGIATCATDTRAVGKEEREQDPTAKLFDPDRIIEVEIEIAPRDWEVLRKQELHLSDLLLGEDCLSRPAPWVYTVFSATVTVDSTRLENVGLRKRGLIGSRDWRKPSLEVEFDSYASGRTFSGLGGRSSTMSSKTPRISGSASASRCSPMPAYQHRAARSPMSP